MIALITSALQGLAAIRDLIEILKDLNLKARLQKLEERQNKMNEGFLKVVSAASPQEKKDAIAAIAASWNS